MSCVSSIHSSKEPRRVNCLAAALIVVCGLTGGCNGEPAAPGLSTAPALQITGLDTDAQAQLTAAHAEFQAEPESALANARLARLLHAYGQLQPAAAYYRRARDFDPQNFELAHLHGLTLSKTGARGEAIEALRRANDLNPTYVPTLLELARLLADEGDLPGSRSYYETVLQTSPDQPQALLGLGKLQQADHPQAALTLMRRAATVAGPYGAGHYAIAQVLRDGGDIEGARVELEKFERYREQAPYLDDPVMTSVRMLNMSRDGHLARGLKAYREGELETSSLEFEKSLEKDPDNTMARPNLIAVYGQLGRYDEAETQYLRGVQSNPNDVKLYTNYALLQIKQNNYPKAIEAYEKAIVVDPGHGKSYIGIGAIREVQGNLDEAIRWYRAALENDPVNRQARQYLGAALTRGGLYKEAIEVLAPAAEPNDLQSAICLQVLAKAQAAALLFHEAEKSLVRAEQLARRFQRPDLVLALQREAEAVNRAHSKGEQP
jgi:tetratricopeptide (TPR) repeat protein